VQRATLAIALNSDDTQPQVHNLDGAQTIAQTHHENVFQLEISVDDLFAVDMVDTS